jgi:hypothetical protein
MYPGPPSFWPPIVFEYKVRMASELLQLSCRCLRLCREARSRVTEHSSIGHRFGAPLCDTGSFGFVRCDSRVGTGDAVL